MSSAIQFLEGMGRGASLFAKAGEDYPRSVDQLEVDDHVRAALIDRDAQALARLIGGRGRMMMQVWAPQEDQPQEEDAPSTEEPREGEGDDRDQDRNREP